jgi:hypothetical protein
LVARDGRSHRERQPGKDLLIVLAGVSVFFMLAVGSASPAARAGTLASGAYRVIVNDGAFVFKSTWTLRVKGNAIRGSSKWSCCPGARVDPLDGSISGLRVTIHRDCSSQGQNVCVRQTYVGQIVANASSPGTGTLSGSWSGDGAAPSNDTFTMRVRLNYKVKLSGRVVEGRCRRKPCHPQVVGVEGLAVTVSGAGGSQTTRTDAKGNYEFIVRAGRQTLGFPRLAKYVKVKPASRTLVANSDTSALDFQLCFVTVGLGGELPGCHLVEIHGRIFDVNGAPYGSFDANHRVIVDANTDGDRTAADAGGRFVLFVEPGDNLVTAHGYGSLPTKESLVVHADHQVNTARLTLPPTLSVSQATASSIFLQLDGLPATPFGLDVIINRTSSGSASGCHFNQTDAVARTTGSRSETVVMTPRQADFPFCPGTYSASLDSGNVTSGIVALASTTFTIPVTVASTNRH